MLDKDKLAAKQAELSKALSAAYLNHEISQLESQVRQLPVDARHNGPGVGEKAQVVNGQAVPVATPQPHAFKRIDDSPRAEGGRVQHGDDAGSDKDIDPDEREDQDDWRVAVVDVSGLMWAPKAVRGLVSKGFEVVVPADGIRTLDLLKKGNSPSAIAARSATRYIEHASRQHKIFSADPSLTIQLGTDYKRGIGLRIQRDDEFRRADEMSSLPLMPGEEGPPKWVKSVLGCAAYFAGINKVELDFQFKESSDPLPVLYVANPPLAVELAQATSANGIGPETKEMRDQAENSGNYLERGEGVVVLQEAERFELGLEVLRDDDDESFDMRRAGGGRGKGRAGRVGQAMMNGKGGGGGGGKGRPRKEEEKQPEVKILLRRQQPAAAPAAADQAPRVDSDGQEISPYSNVSPLPDVTTGPALASAPHLNGMSPLVKSDSLGSALSADISPPRAPHKSLPQPHERKASSKFVPLTRETHPVRRQAGSSDSSDEDTRPGGRPSGRGRSAGRGGRTGRGGKNRDRDRGKGSTADAEFKNGNFTLLQRPTPPPAPKEPTPPPVPKTQTPASARPPKSQNQGPSRGGPPSAPAIRGILARPPRTGPGPGRPPPPGPPPPFAPELRGRGRGRGRGGGIGHFHPPPPPPPPPPLHPRGPPPPAAEFEFDDAMHQPGFGHPGVGGFGHGHGFPPPPPPPHGPGHHHHHHHHAHHQYQYDGPRPGIWRPAPEQPAVVLLQRPK